MEKYFEIYNKLVQKLDILGEIVGLSYRPFIFIFLFYL